MPSPKYHTQAYRRKPRTLQFELLHEESTQKKWDFNHDGRQNEDITVSENLSTRLLDFSVWSHDKQGQHWLAFQLLGIPTATSDELRPDHTIYFRKSGHAWRPDDWYFHFAGAITKEQLSEALAVISKEIYALEDGLKAIIGNNKLKEVERVALFPSFDAYRAYKLGKLYYTIYQLCKLYGLTVVYVPADYLEFWHI